MSNTVRNVTKQLLGAEDVLFGRGVVNQTRGGAVVPVHRLDLELPVADDSELATTDTSKYPRASIGSRSFVAVNGQYQELSHILPVLYRVGGMLSAEYPYCINDDVIAKWTGAFPKTLTLADADFSGAGWQIYTVGSSRTIVSETQPPLSYGKQGFRWYNPNVPATYIYYADGDSGQWVEEASQGVDGALRSDLASTTSTVPVGGAPAFYSAQPLVKGAIFYPEQFFLAGETGHEGMINRAIQAARDFGGGIVDIGAIVRPIAGRIILQRGVLLRASGGCDYSLYPVMHGAVLQPMAEFADNEVIILDSGLENLPLLSGAGMDSFAVDCDNIRLTSKTVIKLKSASNLRMFKDITVLNNDNCIALEISEATVSGSPSGIATDGLEVVNFFTYSKTAHVRTNPIAVIAGNANEVTFRGGKFQCKAAAAIGTRAVDIYSGSRGVTFDGTAFAGCETLVNIVGLNNFAGSPPEWIRFFSCTFETYRIGINITSTGTNAIYFPRFITIDKSNRFITATGASPRKVYVDKSNGVNVELDEFFEGSTQLEITSNALACVAFAQLSGVTNNSATSVVMGRNGGALQVQRGYLEPTIAPTLLNSWTNGSPSNRSLAGYFKDDKGIVHLQGYLAGGTAGTVAFQLPVGYRPPLGVEIAAATNGSNGRITIVNDGNVTIASFTSWIALDGITFRVA